MVKGRREPQWGRGASGSGNNPCGSSLVDAHRTFVRNTVHSASSQGKGNGGQSSMSVSSCRTGMTGSPDAEVNQKGEGG